jgi:hypothetical protein
MLLYFLSPFTLSPSLPLFANTDKFDKESNWWVHCMTGNYLSRWYKYTIGDIMAFQKQIESDLFQKTSDVSYLEAVYPWTILFGYCFLVFVT